MDLISPIDENLDAVEKILTAKTFNECTGGLVSRWSHVFVPRFKVEANYEVSAALKAMGIKRAFVDSRVPGGAEFDGMFVDAAVNTYIAKVVHQAFVEVNEKGTEAAAAVAYMGPVFGSSAAASKTKPFTPTFRRIVHSYSPFVTRERTRYYSSEA